MLHYWWAAIQYHIAQNFVGGNIGRFGGFIYNHQNLPSKCIALNHTASSVMFNAKILSSKRIFKFHPSKINHFKISTTWNAW